MDTKRIRPARRINRHIWVVVIHFRPSRYMPPRSTKIVIARGIVMADDFVKLYIGNHNVN